MTISQLAKAAGVPVSTVRYYERIGLVVPSDRTEKGYRIHDRNDLDRLRCIRSALAVGFALDDMSVLQAAECAEVVRTMQKRLAEVEAKLRELRAVKKTFNFLLRLCPAPDGARCPVPETIRSGRLQPEHPVMA